jgi:hypothetical protein
MDAPAALVWMAPEPPDQRQANALMSWASAHGVSLSMPLPGGTPHLTVDQSVGDKVESLLQTARDAIAARDREQAERALESAESMLRAHPELPQSAWLMAEVERVWSLRFRRMAPVDLEAAERAWWRAEALDGGRVPGVGEEASQEHAPETSVTIESLPENAQAWIDGELMGSRSITVDTHMGLHALVVTEEGAPVWAAWLEAPTGSSTVHLDALAVSACSADDTKRAFISLEGVDGRRVRCRTWVAALASAGSASVRVALCKDTHCGPLVDWSVPAPWTHPTTVERAGHARWPQWPPWPAWATWTAVGAGAAIAAGLLIFALQPTPVETRFVSGGLKTQ